MNYILRSLIVITSYTPLLASTTITVYNKIPKNTQPFDYLVAYVSPNGPCEGHRVVIKQGKTEEATVHGCNSSVTVIFPNGVQATATTSFAAGYYFIEAFQEGRLYYITVDGKDKIRAD